MLLILKENVNVKWFTSWLKLDIQVLASCCGLTASVLFPFLVVCFGQLPLLVLIGAKAVTKGQQTSLIHVRGKLQSYGVFFIPFNFRGQQAKKPRHCEGRT